jgi:hypothetical protein
MSPQLDHSGQFAAFLEHLTDGRGCHIVDAEHGAHNGASVQAGQAKPEKAPAGNLKPCRGHTPICRASPGWRNG